jgi:putative pyruvate formate lyase activating enzyme
MSPEELENRIERAFKLISGCRLCPRKCGVDRTAGEAGFCRTGSMPVVSSWNAHFGEEAPLVGSGGSGTIFFTNCNLGCIYCQNYTISHLGQGEEISFDELAGIMLSLQKRGCHNINLVTPTHQVPMILRALKSAIAGGLNIPIVYNCGGYESVDTLRLLEGIVDIYMPDIKYAGSEIAKKYSYAEDYPSVVKAAVREMHRQVGDLVIDESGIAVKGLIVRHLVLPGNLAGTEEVVRFLAEEISPDTYTNIMAQYHPCFKACEHPPLDRRPTLQEYMSALDSARKAGLKRLATPA